MSKQHDVNRKVLKKMLSYCDKIENFMKRVEASYEVYLSDEMFRIAVDMCVLQIGELTKILTDDFKAQHSEIVWHQIKGLRNVYVHEYENVKFEQAWRTLTQSIPELKAQLEQILSEDLS